jgi:hypothetical protein
VAVVLTRSGGEQTVTALQLAERILARGHRVTVFAHDGAARLTTGDSDVAPAIAALVRTGVHGATLDWVAGTAGDGTALATPHAPGVVPGDHADLWAFVREADVVLTAGGHQWPDG